MNIVMRDNSGKPVSIEIGFKDGKVVSGYNHTTGRKYSVTGAKRIHGGHKAGYRFMSDVYGKSETVPFGVRRTYARQFKQKIPVGRPPKVRKRDVTKSDIGKRTQAIYRRIMAAKNVCYKTAQKLYRHLKTVCGQFYNEDSGEPMVKISRGLTWGDKDVFFVFFYDADRYGPEFTDDPQYTPIFWKSKITYREVLDETLTHDGLEKSFMQFVQQKDDERAEKGKKPIFEHDSLIFLGLSVFDEP